MIAGRRVIEVVGWRSGKGACLIAAIVVQSRFARHASQLFYKPSINSKRPTSGIQQESRQTQTNRQTNMTKVLRTAPNVGSKNFLNQNTDGELPCRV